MFRLLVVDDEARVVNGIYEFLLDISRLELEIMRAYTVYEALEFSKQMKIDILLTDIKMPGMNGLVLADRVLEIWPRCRVIFLSGHNEFNFVQEAIRKGSMDYVLKIDGDESVLQAIDKSIASIEKEWLNEQFIQKAKNKMNMAYPYLRKDLLLSIFNTNNHSPAELTKKFEELDIPLNGNGRVLPVLGKVDRWPSEMTSSDKTLLMYGIQNIAEEYLSKQLYFVSFDYDQSRFVWLLQCKQQDTLEEIYFVEGILESIQSTCKALLKLPISFAVNNYTSSWELIGSSVQSLFILLSYGLGDGEEMIVTNRATKNNHNQPTSGQLFSDFRLKINQLSLLENYIDSNMEKESLKFLQDLLDSKGWATEANQRMHISQEVFYSLSAFWITYLNQRGIFTEISDAIDRNKLTQLNNFQTWQEVQLYFEKLLKSILKFVESKKKDRTNEMISRIHRYIHYHLEEELSLTKLAEYVHLNAAYLSRLYKQITGQGLLEYITVVRIEKAKTLLQSSPLKIHEIVAGIGLESSPYFTRLFKKHTGYTPQEYRDLSK